ncbi:hypothetical protein I317_06799 [Kwoniella heveanensis CBS 569]|nr:hypothetical protein I317_06799 [Kwoniella heveanensis CBS 569]
MHPDRFPPALEESNHVGYWGCEMISSTSAWSLARNEDEALRTLIDLQGREVSNYYGLYAWYDKKRKHGARPDTVVMVMEDVGEQEKYPDFRRAYHLTAEEKNVDNANLGESDDFVIVDFQKAEFVEEMSESDREDSIAGDMIELEIELLMLKP